MIGSTAHLSFCWVSDFAISPLMSSRIFLVNLSLTALDLLSSNSDDCIPVIPLKSTLDIGFSGYVETFYPTITFFSVQSSRARSLPLRDGETVIKGVESFSSSSSPSSSSDFEIVLTELAACLAERLFSLEEGVPLTLTF